MTLIKVKICGITCKEDLITALNAGADAVGFIVNVPFSPRNLSLKKAEELMHLVPIFVDGVIVIVPEDTSSLLDACEYIHSDAIQIHGNAQLNISTIRKKLPHVKLIRAIQMKNDTSVENLVESTEPFDALLIDTFMQGAHGGPGIIHDWESSRLLRQALSPKPLILAGGLKPENINDAIRLVQPYAVDVSSGVESYAGRKNAEKVFRFIKNAKEVKL